ncbi:hypothetical protein [Frondihabitans peucedani]|uniref:Secreted protein n=1 Tax=Frondihabitans peucedani TaxID=598626 RepID=A0ABP8E4D4_9MICO
MERRRRTRGFVLAGLYLCAATAAALAITAILHAVYLGWALGLVASVTALLVAYRIRTGRRPWSREGA